MNAAKLTALACLTLVVALAGPARAGTYVAGSLPFEFGGGILPVDPAMLPNLLKASKEAERLRTAIHKCYAAGALNFSKSKPSKLAECLTDPVKGALTRYAAKIQAIATVPPGLPDCADFAGRAATIAEQVQALVGPAYCDGGPTPTPSPTPTPTPSPSPTPPPTFPLDGTWTGTWASDTPGSSGTLVLTIVQSGDELAGTITMSGSPCYGSSPLVLSSVVGGVVQVGTIFGGPPVQAIELTGSAAGNEMSGTYEATFGDCDGDVGTWSVSR